MNCLVRAPTLVLSAFTSEPACVRVLYIQCDFVLYRDLMLVQRSPCSFLKEDAEVGSMVTEAKQQEFEAAIKGLDHKERKKKKAPKRRALGERAKAIDRNDGSGDLPSLPAKPDTLPEVDPLGRKASLKRASLAIRKAKVLPQTQSWQQPVPTWHPTHL